jgi:hypothetical protein
MDLDLRTEDIDEATIKAMLVQLREARESLFCHPLCVAAKGEPMLTVPFVRLGTPMLSLLQTSLATSSRPTRITSTAAPSTKG